jgi:hypothetical protein
MPHHQERSFSIGAVSDLHLKYRTHLFVEGNMNQELYKTEPLRNRQEQGARVKVTIVFIFSPNDKIETFEETKI